MTNEQAVTLKLELGRMMRLARKFSGRSQAQVAEAAGLARAHVTRIEAGTYSPALDTFAAFCLACDLDPGAVLSGVLEAAEIRTPSPRKKIGGRKR